MPHTPIIISHKHVISSTIGDPGWEGTTVLRGNVADEVTALKDQPAATS
jgi:hypothetical protein